MEKEYIVSSSDYISMGMEVIRQYGVSKEHAGILMDNFLDCDKKGIFTHGFVRLPTYIMQIKRGNINPQPKINKIKDDSIVKLIDGDHALGAVAGHYAMQEAIKISSEYGVGVVGVRNSTHFGTAAYYTEMASQNNQIGITFTNASPGIAPTGSLKPLLGNNPWSISVPTNFAYPVTMDIANSIVARGKIRVANSKGESIPLGWAINKFGESTTDPKEALDGGAILPIGDYKGYGITFMIEILTGVLTGSGFGNQNAGVAEDGKRNNGHLFLSLNVEKFMEIAHFKQRVGDLVHMVKSLPKIDENKDILLPGEIEWQRKLELEEGTVKVSEQIYDVMVDLSNEYEVKIPASQVVTT
ncbi:Ldh family oxidoreductase [Shouchella shacheensis]|uniref:Ldh family oxidoreductase n=1 Tax=Shouchella shacheensis TaxID=1649580 RepID=UPI00073FFCE1|nr:Ldh family oxidoreductase [Shouchella shacheensis]